MLCVSDVDEMNQLHVSNVPTDDDKFLKFIIYVIGFTEGLTSLANLSLSYLFKDDLKLSPPEMSIIFAFPALPWIFRILISFCIDFIKISSSNKRAYLMLFSTIQALGYIGLAIAPLSLFACVISLILISTGSAFCTTVAEGLVVKNVGGDSRKGCIIIGDFMTAKAIAHLLVAYFSGYLLEYFSKTSIFVATATFPMVITAGSYFMNEAPVLTQLEWPGFESQINKVVAFLTTPQLFPKVLYIFLYTAGPDYDDALFFFCTNELQFDARFMGVLRLSYAIAALVGVQLYRRYFWKKRFKTLILISNMIILPLYMSPMILVTRLNQKLKIPDKVFVLSGGFLIEAAFELQILPLLSRIAQICPSELESTVLAAMLSIRSIGRVISNSLSGLISYMFGITATDFGHLPGFILLCSISTAMPLLLVPMMEKEQLQNEDDEEKLIPMSESGPSAVME